MSMSSLQLASADARMGKEDRATTVPGPGISRLSLRQCVCSLLLSVCTLGIPIKSAILGVASFSGSDVSRFYVPHIGGVGARSVSLTEDEYLPEQINFPPAAEEARDGVFSQWRGVRRGVAVQRHEHFDGSAINSHEEDADVSLEQLMNDLGVGEDDVEERVSSWQGTSHSRSGADVTMNAFGFSELKSTKSSTAPSDSVKAAATRLNPSDSKYREQRVMDLLEQLETLTRQTPVAGEDDQFVDFSFEPDSVTTSDINESPSSVEGRRDVSQAYGDIRPKSATTLFRDTEAGISMTDVSGDDDSSARHGDKGDSSNEQAIEPPSANEAAESDSSHDSTDVADGPAEAGTEDPSGGSPHSPESEPGNAVAEESLTSMERNEKDTAAQPISTEPVAEQPDVETTYTETNTQTPKRDTDDEIRQQGRMEAHSSTQTVTSKAPADFSDMMLARLREASRGMASVLQIVEHGRLLDDDSLVTVAYHFPFETRESRRIAFIIVALPPGYTARAGRPLCESVDPDMPPLSCEVRLSHLPENALRETSEQNVFIQVSSADKSRSLPLGMHHFAVAVHTPRLPIAPNIPANWWFVTFRFTGGHAVTKHFENRVLIAREKCTWGSWRQETPCSSTCGEGVEVWSRTLFGGESEEACGGALLKKKCFRAECSVNCQLGPWETIVDCTKSCDADNRRGYQVSIRKVLMDKDGWGVDCKRLYPWNPEAREGWSGKLGAVVRLSVCDTKFRQACEPELGCRVEEVNTRTLSVSYPWGSCPFPCGGLGKITSIVQVANGIPRWLGEKDFPESFQVPCRADKEPLVKRVPCNTFDCEDCSVYLEHVKDTTSFRAWIFFLPSQDANTIRITAPRGINFDLNASASATDAKSGEDQTGHPRADGTGQKAILAENHAVGAGQAVHWKATHLLPQARMPTEEEISVSAAGRQKTQKSHAENQRSTSNPDTETGKRTPEGIRELYNENACATFPTSFGYISSCGVSPSTKYEGAQQATMHLSGFIAPRVDADFDRRIYPHLQPESAERHLKEGYVEENRRPEWMAVPVTLEQTTEMETSGNFYMWLSSTSSPRDPEVFKCHLKTKLAVPVKCRYDYSVVDPTDCADCHLGSPKKIMTFRQFVPAKHGGSCSIPLEQRFKNAVAVYAKCTKGCGHVQDMHSSPGAAEETSGTNVDTGKIKTEATPLSSRLKSVSRGTLKRILDRAANRLPTENGMHEAVRASSQVYRIDVNGIPAFEDVMKQMADTTSSEEMGELHTGRDYTGGSQEHTDDAAGSSAATDSSAEERPVRLEAESERSDTGSALVQEEGSSTTNSGENASDIEEESENGKIGY
ncbi:Tsp1 domain TSP12 (precursor),related protein [Toxoplasma gondii VAND]|uniref:Tsp1 domain TSP12 (Precursor),related protein n=1 Tax=Toxoplasma gondii VAND TaxID=933077 RepID=A0A086PMK1_TOXGO|nr:Tsp1 domain TSP12 (precursor),related protein [Toxoplasma gondii VAND]